MHAHIHFLQHSDEKSYFFFYFNYTLIKKLSGPVPKAYKYKNHSKKIWELQAGGQKLGLIRTESEWEWLYLPMTPDFLIIL